MKRFSWIMGLILCVVCTVQAKDRVIERPPFLAWSSSNIEVDKIVMSDTVTTVYIKAFYRPKYWIKIASGSFLKDEKGALYPIRKGVGITLDKEFWMPESGEAEFQLLFPPIPANVTSLDFSEGDFDGAYKIWGIQLNEKDFRKSALPKGAVIHKINKKAELPVPEFAYGKATLKGQVTGYQKDMPSSGQLRLKRPDQVVKLCRRSNYQGRRKFSGSDRCYYRNSCHPCFPLCTNSLLAGSWKRKYYHR